MSGSSAAAAVVAGAAALLAQARPELDASGAARALLVGTARPRPWTARPGRGLSTSARAAAAEVGRRAGGARARPRDRRGWQARRRARRAQRLARPLRRRGLGGRLGEVGGAGASPSPPARFPLAPGERAGRRRRAAGVRARRAQAGRRPTSSVRAGGGAPVARSRGAHVRPRTNGDLLGGVAAVDATLPAVGHRAGGAPLPRRPVVDARRLGARCCRSRASTSSSGAAGERLGLLARLRDLLPGRYTFGLTGRGPAGRRLAARPLPLRLIGYPPGEGPPSRRSVQFTIR